MQIIVLTKSVIGTGVKQHCATFFYNESNLLPDRRTQLLVAILAGNDHVPCVDGHGAEPTKEAATIIMEWGVISIKRG